MVQFLNLLEKGLTQHINGKGVSIWWAPIYSLFQSAQTTKYWAAQTEKWHTAPIIDFATALLGLDGFVFKETREQKCPLGAPLRTDAGL